MPAARLKRRLIGKDEDERAEALTFVLHVDRERELVGGARVRCDLRDMTGVDSAFEAEHALGLSAPAAVGHALHGEAADPAPAILRDADDCLPEDAQEIAHLQPTERGSSSR
jgi:hypothetical protein